MVVRRCWKPLMAIALFLGSTGFGWSEGRAFVANAAPQKPSPTGTAASGSPASGSAASQDPSYYAYATRYYLQYLGSREQARNNAQDPYHFFKYYQFYQDRYAPSAGGTQQAPAWFATMPFRNARTQAFARFVQQASPSATPSPQWVQRLP